MPSTQVVTATNRLLAALPDKDRQNLLASCESVELMLGDVLGNADDSIHYIYYPIDCVISLVMTIDGGSDLEVGLIGNEGMLGIPFMLGVDATPFHGLVLAAGPALRITAPSFFRELEQSPALQQNSNLYLHVLMSQLAQTAACNRFHQIEERLARLLLMIRDRAHSEKLHITHELLAQMLGVRRVGVTKAAGSLQKKKLISYSRGDIKIHNIGGLEAASCKCYQADNETYDHILHC